MDPGRRAGVRHEWELADDVPVVGWVGRLDRQAGRGRTRGRCAARGGPPRGPLGAGRRAGLRLPRLRGRAAPARHRPGLDGVVRWLGDRADVPRLLAGLDALVRLSEDEGIPHVLAQAGAACLPVVATRDNGAAEQIADGRSGLFVPHRAPAAAAAARSRLVRDPDRAALRARAQGLTDVHLHVTHVRDDPAVVGRVRARGLLVAVGIVDDPDEAEAMAALGVDLLCTDDPVGLGLAQAGRTSADAAVVAG